MAFIYAIQADEGGPIKIGITKGAVESRMADLQIGNAALLCAVGILEGFPGLPKIETMERMIHALLRDSYIRGEWFKPTSLVLAVVHLMSDKHGLWRITNMLFDQAQWDLGADFPEAGYGRLTMIKKWAYDFNPKFCVKPISIDPTATDYREQLIARPTCATT